MCYAANVHDVNSQSWNMSHPQAPHVPAKSSPRWLKNAWQALSLPAILFIVLPILSVFLRLSPGEFWTNLKLQQVQQAIQLSLATSLATVGLTVLIGTPVAYLLCCRRSRFYRLIDTLMDLPTVLPPSVAGVALLMTFGRQGFVGAWLSPLGVSIPFTNLAVVLAQMFVAAPFYIKAATLGFANIDCELKKAAALDGANRWQVFHLIVVPMSWMSLVSGCVITWARALGEFGATIIFAGNFPGRTQTMPLAIYIGFELDLNVALTLSAILICCSFLMIMLVKGILHNRIEVSLEEASG
jgi:molybdate transport system permease protein